MNDVIQIETQEQENIEPIVEDSQSNNKETKLMKLFDIESIDIEIAKNQSEYEKVCADLKETEKQLEITKKQYARLSLQKKEYLGGVAF
ncbi:hypothetical protein OQH61_03540 [Helicobacter sp. MIT 21-1697]|uniref:hypothetical protein n=1 Tax=Helicobacter sp. MIT 21-1697 TaxID=2993733 RepID=UPI00224AB62D|nr:hypothetical protein [Helicobacter sp. MIT 21-1697]MCX2716807.1 hypothetical protein [Helicobacter sp. MIT 21-1697]